MKFGDGWVAQVYLVRHLKAGILTDCVYAEPPTPLEMRETATHHGLDNNPDLLRVVEVPLTSGLAHRSEAIAALDEWTPPPLPEVACLAQPVLDADNQANVIRWEVKVSGVGVVTNPEDK